MKTKKFFTPFLIVLILASCQKDLETPKQEDNIAGSGILSVTERLSTGNWKFSSSVIKYSDGTIDDSPLDNCKTDDLYQFEADGDATVVHGIYPCVADPVNGKYADWQLIENGNRLREVYIRDFLNESAGTVIIYHVDFINNENLVISRTVSEGGKTYTITDRYQQL